MKAVMIVGLSGLSYHRDAYSKDSYHDRARKIPSVLHIPDWTYIHHLKVGGGERMVLFTHRAQVPVNSLVIVAPIEGYLGYNWYREIENDNHN